MHLAEDVLEPVDQRDEILAERRRGRRVGRGADDRLGLVVRHSRSAFGAKPPTLHQSSTHGAARLCVWCWLEEPSGVPSIHAKTIVLRGMDDE